jgi:hypothetical protein
MFWLAFRVCTPGSEPGAAPADDADDADEPAEPAEPEPETEPETETAAS